MKTDPDTDAGNTDLSVYNRKRGDSQLRRLATENEPWNKVTPNW